MNQTPPNEIDIRVFTVEEMEGMADWMLDGGLPPDDNPNDYFTRQLFACDPEEDLGLETWGDWPQVARDQMRTFESVYMAKLKASKRDFSREEIWAALLESMDESGERALSWADLAARLGSTVGFTKTRLEMIGYKIVGKPRNRRLVRAVCSSCKRRYDYEGEESNHYCPRCHPERPVRSA